MPSSMTLPASDPNIVPSAPAPVLAREVADAAEPDAESEGDPVLAGEPALAGEPIEEPASE